MMMIMLMIIILKTTITKNGNSNTDNVDTLHNNSLGHGPIGVLDLLQGPCCFVPSSRILVRRDARSGWNSPGHGPIGVLDLVYRPRPSCCCSQTAQSGRPRARGGQSRSHAVGPKLPQSPARPWRLHTGRPLPKNELTIIFTLGGLSPP